MKLTKTLFTTFLGASIFAFPSATWANTVEEQFQQGLAAAEKRRSSNRFPILETFSRTRRCYAQLLLGGMHEKGKA